MSNIDGPKKLESPKKTSGPPGSGIYRVLKGLMTGSREEAFQAVSEEKADAPQTVYEEAANILKRVKSTLESLGEAAQTQLHEELQSAAQSLRSLLTGSRRLRKYVDSTKNEQPVSLARLNSVAAQVSARGHLQRECGNNESKMRKLIEGITAQLRELEEAA